MSARSKELAALVERSLETIFDRLTPAPAGTDKLFDAMRYTLLGGGKRLRAVFLIEFCELFDGSVADAIDFACALECIHAYSLIHDDLPCMDDDDMRRGKPACHKAFGESTAMLAGDALQTAAFELMLSASVDAVRAREAARIVAAAAGPSGMCGGQLLDLENETLRANRERLEATCLLKTGALFSAACEAGAVLGGADEAGRTAAREYARGVGLAFQVADDLLDVVGSAEEFGKATGADARRGKSTFASELGIDACKALIRELTDAAKAAIAPIGGSDELCALAEELVGRSF